MIIIITTTSRSTVCIDRITTPIKTLHNLEIALCRGTHSAVGVFVIEHTLMDPHYNDHNNLFAIEHYIEHVSAAQH